MIRWYGRKNLGTGILQNETDGGEGASGYKHTEETKLVLRKYRAIQGGRLHSENSKQKMRELAKDRAPVSVATRVKQSLSHKGRPSTRLNYTHSVETRQKISLANSGNKHSAETKKQISEKLAGIKRAPRSIDHIQKIKESLKNTEPFVCMHCGKSGHPSGMLRWHGNNCKQKDKHEIQK